MKMRGSNRGDTLIGTAGNDRIEALGGDDLLFTAGGADIIKAGSGDDLIAGFAFDLNNVLRSDNRRAQIDGGAGNHDIMVVELSAARRVSEVDAIFESVSVRNVEEFIYNFESVKSKQTILGSDKQKGIETIIIGSGNARVDMRAGDDFVFTGSGDDIVKGGKGADFIHAGEGHNIVTGGSGGDYFHFQITNKYQYTEITDFKAGQDKILLSIDVAQINFFFERIDDEWESEVSPLPVRGYGDGHYGIGPALNKYVSYNHGREFDPGSFSTDDDILVPEIWARYEKETGSIFAMHYEEDAAGRFEVEAVLIAHVKPGTDIGVDDILFRMI